MKGVRQIKARIKELESDRDKLELSRLRNMVDGIEAHLVRDKINLLRWVLDLETTNK